MNLVKSACRITKTDLTDQLATHNGKVVKNRRLNNGRQIEREPSARPDLS